VLTVALLVWSSAASAQFQAPPLPAGAARDTSVDQIENLLSTLDGRVDGLETLLSNISGFVDGLEGLVDGLEGQLSTLDGRVDGLEGGLGAAGDAAATAGSTGSVSAKLRLVTSQLDALATELAQKTEPANNQAVNLAQVLGSALSATNPVFVRAVNSAGAMPDDPGDGVAMGSSVSVPTACHAEASPSAVTEDQKSDDSCSLLGARYVATNGTDPFVVTSVPADPFGANADAASATGSISAKLRFIAVTGIPITSLPTLAAVTTVSTLTGGGVAHDSPDSGNPLKTGARAVAGLSGLAMVAANERTDSLAGLDGATFVRPDAGLEDVASGDQSNTDGSSFQVIAAPGAGVKTYLTDATCTNTSTTGVYVQIKSGTTTRWTLPVPAAGASDVNGVTRSWRFPLAPNAANEAWNFDPSAAVTTLICSANGFKSKI